MPVEIVIVDDDPMVGELTSDLLSEAGYTSALIQDSSLALEAVREHRPRLVLLDILMPGVDGLSLLHSIKQDPTFQGIKVAVVSAKNFQAEIDRAKSYGADLFVRKPYDVQAFPKQVSELIGPPAGSGSQPPLKAKVVVRAWGSASSSSSPCLSVESKGRLFVLDAGEGAIALAEEQLRSGRREAWLLLSHYHPDHIAGLGRLPFLRQEGFALHVLGPAQPEKGLDAHLREAVEASFSKDRRPVTANISLHELREDSYELAPGLRINAFYLNHPGTTLGYLLHLEGKRLAYCPDSELYGDGETALQDYDERTARICRGVDLLVHDGRWLREDRAAHLNSGHSDAATAGAFAADCEAGRLWLYHCDPDYSEAQRQTLLEQARAAMDEKGTDVPCELALDGAKAEF